jgi:hypothetical protein
MGDLITTLTPANSTAGASGPPRPNPIANLPALTMTVKSVQPVTVGVGVTSVTTAYVFDTAMNIEHDQEGVVTNNPVQTGTSLNDHFYLLPMRVTAEIGMSDSMQSYTIGQFSGSTSRSVSAYQTLLTIQASRTPVSIATRLATTGISSYATMMIVSIRAQEDKDTRFSGKFWVTFQQIITANLSIVPGASGLDTTNNTRPQAACATEMGQTLTQNVPSNVQQQNNIANASPDMIQNVPDVNGAGAWSSYNVNSGGNLSGTT